MNGVFVHGFGAVSPAGWGAPALFNAVRKGEPLPVQELPRPGLKAPLKVRRIPPPETRPAFLAHPRLRRTSSIAQHTVSAALEALGDHLPEPGAVIDDLGVIVSVMSGCVTYSRRFYDETLKDPATASPLIFPETVFNAPASHLSSLLGSTGINYTLVGDPGTFLQAIALGSAWLDSGRINACLIVGSEEIDWLTTEAFVLFDRKVIVSEGAGALYLRREKRSSSTPRLAEITDPYLFSKKQSRKQAALCARRQLSEPPFGSVLFDGLTALPRLDAAESAAWADWDGDRFSPKIVLGEGLMASSAWQCVAAVDALQRGFCPSATVSVVGSNEQAIAARFDAGEFLLASSEPKAFG